MAGSCPFIVCHCVSIYIIYYTHHLCVCKRGEDADFYTHLQEHSGLSFHYTVYIYMCVHKPFIFFTPQPERTPPSDNDITPHPRDPHQYPIRRHPTERVEPTVHHQGPDTRTPSQRRPPAPEGKMVDPSKATLDPRNLSWSTTRTANTFTNKIWKMC